MKRGDRLWGRLVGKGEQVLGAMERLLRRHELPVDKDALLHLAARSKAVRKTGLVHGCIKVSELK